jgi:hypothetical protein
MSARVHPDLPPSHIRSAHSIKLVEGRKVILNHNAIANHSSFAGYARAEQRDPPLNITRAKRLAKFILLKLTIAGHHQKKTTINQLDPMVNKIIKTRQRNQARFMRTYETLMIAHHGNMNQMNAQIRNARQRVKQNHPGYTNAMVNNHANVKRLQNEKAEMRKMFAEHTNSVSRHARHIAAWKWVQNRVIPIIKSQVRRS